VPTNVRWSVRGLVNHSRKLTLGKRINRKNTAKVERVEVAASGDMAWEFSCGEAEYDVDETPSRCVSFETGILRVWKKVDGRWKMAAAFTRPLDVPFTPSGCSFHSLWVRLRAGP
jgi:hypothetical protein